VNQILPWSTVFLPGSCQNPWSQFATSSARYPGCPTPTITAVKPDIWFAGKSYDVKITGTNFTTTADSNKTGCPVTTITIAAADGSPVPISNVSVDTDKQITLSGVAPPAADPTETATITVGTAPNTANSSTLATQPQILGNQITCGLATMNCTQPVISTTDGSDPPVQSVVVGQPIQLTTPPLPAGITATSTTWTIEGTNIGGYTLAADSSSATVTPTDLKSAALNTYWIYPKDPIPVTYKYCVNIPSVGKQCSPTATATFKVSGPTGNIVYTMSPTPQTWNVRPLYDCDTKAQIYDMVFGWRNLGSLTCLLSFPSTTGINFTASLSNEPDSGGNVSWVQVISSVVFSGVTPSGPSPPYTEGPGLDNVYPYPPTNAKVPGVAHDSPASELISPYTKETEDFTAKMYLLWTSKVDPASIPVPLGYVKWTISGTAVYEPSRPSPWPWRMSPGSTGTAAFATSSDNSVTYHGMPHWTTVVQNTQGVDQTENDVKPVPTDREEEDQ
jgi:hypothetical protein